MPPLTESPSRPARGLLRVESYDVSLDLTSAQEAFGSVTGR